MYAGIQDHADAKKWIIDRPFTPPEEVSGTTDTELTQYASPADEHRQKSDTTPQSHKTIFANLGAKRGSLSSSLTNDKVRLKNAGSGRRKN